MSKTGWIEGFVEKGAVDGCSNGTGNGVEGFTESEYKV